MALTVVGVRHHSPACARLVEATLRELRPRFVLVEGPSDMNDRMDEMLLGHELPVALFTYRQDADGRSRSSWSPFCAYSPEWVALTVGREVGATPLFIDLPAWHPAFEGEENRYSDRHVRASDSLVETCARLGFENTDALWDHLFEQPRANGIGDLRAALASYFEAIRADEPPGPRDLPREDYMARYVAWALAEAGEEHVVVVCGGFHEPALLRAIEANEANEAKRASTSRHSRPSLEALPDGTRVGSYLVPFSFRRLDSFAGYASGMPSPAYYQAVWDEGPEAAAETMLFTAIRHLRKKRQRVSPADAIAASTLARGLAAVRGHDALSRIDVLDGLAGALVKDALVEPLPWTRRGVLSARTEPMLAEVVHAFAGFKIGTLHRDTPRPPLVHDAVAELERIGLPLTRQTVRAKAKLTDPDGARKSMVLHRFRVLGIPGIALARAANLSRTKTDLSEEWTVTHMLETDPALVEASLYGATLEGAAQARIEEESRGAADVGAIADALERAAACGLRTLTEGGLADIARRVGTEPSFAALGRALVKLLALRRGELVLGARGQSELPKVLEACFDRGLWLFEGMHGPDAALDSDHIAAVGALREVLRETEDADGTMSTRALECCERRSRDAAAPPALRGAALGFLWSMRRDEHDTALPHELLAGDHEDADANRTIAVLRAMARPSSFGDFLGGLFALGRAEVVRSPALVSTIDASIKGFLPEDFMIALPALRQAFGYFPPRERLAIAEAVLALGGKKGHDPMILLRAPADSGALEAGAAIEKRVATIEARFGLGAAKEPS